MLTSPMFTLPLIEITLRMNMDIYVERHSFSARFFDQVNDLFVNCGVKFDNLLRN